MAYDWAPLDQCGHSPKSPLRHIGRRGGVDLRFAPALPRDASPAGPSRDVHGLPTQPQSLRYPRQCGEGIGPSQDRIICCRLRKLLQPVLPPGLDLQRKQYGRSVRGESRLKDRSPQTRLRFPIEARHSAVNTHATSSSVILTNAHRRLRSSILLVNCRRKVLLRK